MTAITGDGGTRRIESERLSTVLDRTNAQAIRDAMRAAVEGEIVAQGRHAKVVHFRKKKEGWTKKRGHRQPYTEVVITEGNYLLVNKNLIEAAAVAVVLVFRTGRFAGLDLLRGRERTQPLPSVAEATR